MTDSEYYYYDSMVAPEDKKIWVWERYLELNTMEKSFFEKKVAAFLEVNNVDYLYKCPVWIPRDKRIYFVDFYLPDYSLILDIETKRESPFYNEKSDEIRRLLLSHIKGMGYHRIKRRDLMSDDFRCKISGAMLSRWNHKKGRNSSRKKNKSLDNRKKSK